MDNNFTSKIASYRWWITGGLGILAIAVVLFLLFNYRNNSAYKLVSQRTGLVLSISNPGKFLSTTQSADFSSALGKWVVCEKFRSDLGYFEKLLTAGEMASDKLKLTLALQMSSAQTLDFLYILEMPSGVNVRKIIGSSGLQYKQNNFNGHSLFTVYFNKTTSYSFVKTDNLLVAARHTEMVEDALSVLDSGSGISEDPAFSKLQEKLDSQPSDGRIFINAAAVPSMLSSFMTPDGKTDLQLFSDQLNWCGANFSCGRDGIDFTGNLFSKDGTPAFGSAPEQGFHEQLRITEVLPSSTAVLFWLGAGDFKTYANKEDINSDFGRYIAPWAGEEAACSITEPLSAEAAAEVFAIVRVRDSTLAKNKLKQLEISKELGYESTYNSYTIRQLKHQKILAAITGKLISPKDPYYTFIGQYAIFCSSRAALELCIDKYLAGETMAEEQYFKQFNNKFEEKSSRFFYVNLAKIEQQLKSALQREIQDEMAEQFESLHQLNLLGLQIYPSEDGFSFKGKWRSSGSSESETTASFAWKVLLDSEAGIPPAITLSEDGQSKEVFIQDRKNQIYVINSAGEIRIKLALDEPILSDISHINYNNSGQLYYLFNTAHKIHMLDSKGNEVFHFPIVLQTAATTGMLVTDFDNSGVFHFFVPVKNGKVYGFENNGKPLAGWNPRSGVGLVRQPMRHLQFEGSDYLLALGDQNLMVLKRNGELSMNPIPLAGEYLSPPAYQCDEEAQRIVVMNSVGTTTNINLQGTAFNMSLGGGVSKQMRICYADVAGDGRFEYITLDGGNISCKGYNGASFSKFFDYKSEEKVDDIFTFKLPGEDKSYVGYICKSISKVFLLQPSGQLHKDFPLAGTTPFRISDFFGDGKTSLIVANGASVYIYKMQ